MTHFYSFSLDRTGALTITQEFCRLIFSTACVTLLSRQHLYLLATTVSIIDAHLSSMNYDARKLPLGKLAKSTVLNGFSALKVSFVALRLLLRSSLSAT